MDPSGEASGGLDLGAEGENCLKEIANNYVEEEDGDNSSGEETGVGWGNGLGLPAHLGERDEGRHALVENGSEECRVSLDDSGNNGGRLGAASNGSGEEHPEDSSEKEEGDEEDEGVVDEEEDEADKDGEQERRGQSRGTAGGGSREMDAAENGFTNELDRQRQSADASERVGNAVGAKNGVEVGEKSETESEGGPYSGVAEGGRTLRRRRGRPLKANELQSSIRGAPITPKLEEPRAVRANRGIKRRFPGDESEDSLPKRVRVRSIASVCGDVSQSVKGEDVSMDDSVEVTMTKRRCRARRSEGPQGSVKSDEAEVSPAGGTGKRKMVETAVDADNLKRACHGKNGTVFACNAEGCKKRFAEAAALYAHARVHGDRPYVCHYEGCIKSFSERSKLKRHFLIHTGEKPFLCLHEGCGKAFSLDFNLRSHMKTHTGEYNECPYEGCEKRYCQEYKLRAHIAKEHGKAAKKVAKVVGNDVRGRSGSKARDAAAAKKQEMVCALATKRSKLESMREGRVSRMKELEEEKQREAREVARIEQDLKKVERLQRQLEEGEAGSPSVSVSEEEDADDEEEDDEEEAAAAEEGDEEESEEPCLSNGAAVHTNSLGEQHSRLEYTAMGEGKDVIMFAHKLPTADQGARLVKTVDARAPEPRQEPTTSLTPQLWLQGPPPHHGHLAQQSALRPLLRSRRAGVPDVANPTITLKPCPSLERAPSESTGSGLVKSSGVGRWGGGSAEGSTRKAAKKHSSPAGVQRISKTFVHEKGGVNGKVDQKAPGREKDSHSRADKHLSFSSEAVFLNPILLSSNHRFSPTDARSWLYI